MSLFPERPERPRIAAFVDYEFPIDRDRAIYERLDAWAAPLDAECRVVHTVVADPAAQPIALRPRFGAGLFVPQDPHIHLNDVEHCRDTLADRFAALTETLTALAGVSLANLMVQREMQEAFSMTRWLRAWQPDLIVSLGLGQGAMQAMVAAHMLDVPRVAAIDTLDEASVFARLLPLHAQQADLIVAEHGAVRAAIAAHLPADTDKLSAADADDLLRRVAALLGRRRTDEQPRLGPAAAFRTRAVDAPPLRARPFLVLGTERTGSNMLVDMLSTSADVACAGELFNPRRIHEQRLDWLRGSDDDHAALMALRLRSPAELLAHLAASARRMGKAHVGCKLLYFHGLIDDRVTDAFAARAELAVVHLTRRQRLRQSLSMARATASDEWFARHGEARPNGRPHALDTRQVATDFVMHELFEQRYRALFRGQRVLELDYGDLANRLPDATARLSELLECGLDELRPRTSKTGGRDLSTAIENFADVRDALAGTPWAQLAEDERGDE